MHLSPTSKLGYLSFKPESYCPIIKESGVHSHWFNWMKFALIVLADCLDPFARQ